MRKIWCSKCEKWVDYDPSFQEKEKVRADHLQWCGLDYHLLELHPDLEELEDYIDSMYG